MKVLVIGPSPERAKGGMSTVISDIRDNQELHREFEIDIYDSYIDGGKIVRIFYCVLAFIRFWFTKSGYDVYHIHMAQRGSTFRKGCYVRAAKRWGKRVIVHIHGSQYMEFYQALSESGRKHVLSILNAADLVVALSEGWKFKFEQTFGLTNCVVLENGIDVGSLCAAVTPAEKFQNSFLTLGRLGKRKGTYDLVEAAALAAQRVPDLKVYLAGDGDVEQIRELVAQKHLERNIEVVGWADAERKMELLSRVSTVVLPSYNEGLPMSVLEGMACGKTIISTTVGAIPEVVTQENGILIEPGDVDALAEALVRCAEDSPMVKRMSEENMKKVRRSYSMETMHKRLAEYYCAVGGL